MTLTTKGAVKLLVTILLLDIALVFVTQCGGFGLGYRARDSLYKDKTVYLNLNGGGKPFVLGKINGNECVKDITVINDQATWTTVRITCR